MTSKERRGSNERSRVDIFSAPVVTIVTRVGLLFSTVLAVGPGRTSFCLLWMYSHGGCYFSLS